MGGAGADEAAVRMPSWRSFMPAFWPRARLSKYFYSFRLAVNTAGCLPQPPARLLAAGSARRRLLPLPESRLLSLCCHNKIQTLQLSQAARMASPAQT